MRTAGATATSISTGSRARKAHRSRRAPTGASSASPPRTRRRRPPATAEPEGHDRPACEDARVSTATRPRGAHISAVLRERQAVTPLELFFDLVFVLALTQCTALMAADPSWQGVAKALLVLAVLWWSWTGYTWLSSVLDPEEGAVRLVMFAAMAGLLVAALCVPEAFGDSALVFACAYAVVRGAH